MAERHKSPHVLLFPFPMQGHLNPFIQFGKRLLSKGVKTTLATTVYNNNCTLSHNTTTTTTSIAIETISDGFDDGGYASSDSTKSYLKKFREVGSKSLADVIKKLDSEGNTVDAIVYDSFIIWALDVAMEFGIDGGCFFTQACGVNDIYYHVHKGLVPKTIQTGSTVSVPGLPRLEHWETPAFIQDPGPYPGWSDLVVDQFSNIDKARWLFSNTFYKLEEEVIEWMRKMWRLKVIGPTIPSLYLDKRLADDTDYGINLIEPNHIECMNWLNDKPKGSVVYIAFGSWVEVGTEQMEELSWALNDSGVNFLWVVRESEEKKLPKGLAYGQSKKGLVVAWCRQLEVLAHESVGCFITHCGLNSILEAITMRVPIVAMPQWTDQTTNAKFVEDVWGVGLRAARGMGIVRGGNIVTCIKEIMEGEKGVIAKKNAIKWRDLAKEAVDEGGSSDKDLDEFVYELN